MLESTAIPYKFKLITQHPKLLVIPVLMRVRSLLAMRKAIATPQPQR
ncbi:MAG: hypothetical protein AAFW70_10860 [Cyanobacteria bacterium J06635_10]